MRLTHNVLELAGMQRSSLKRAAIEKGPTLQFPCPFLYGTLVVNALLPSVFKMPLGTNIRHHIFTWVDETPYKK